MPESPGRGGSELWRALVLEMYKRATRRRQRRDIAQNEPWLNVSPGHICRTAACMGFRLDTSY